MTIAGWVMLVLSQLGVVVVVGFAMWVAINEKIYLAWVPVLAIIIVDVLVLVGVFGPGLPLSAKTGTELLVADFGGLALFYVFVGLNDDDAKMIAGFIVGLLVVGLAESLLLAGGIWSQHHLTIGSPTPTVTATSGLVPGPTVTVTRTVTATPGPAPAPTVTVTVTVTVTNPASASGQSASEGVAVAIALVGAGGALIGGLGTLLVGWGTFSEHRKRSKKPQEPPP